jgi:hypothetical protein
MTAVIRGMADGRRFAHSGGQAAPKYSPAAPQIPRGSQRGDHDAHPGATSAVPQRATARDREGQESARERSACRVSAG